MKFKTFKTEKNSSPLKGDIKCFTPDLNIIGGRSKTLLVNGREIETPSHVNSLTITNKQGSDETPTPEFLFYGMQNGNVMRVDLCNNSSENIEPVFMYNHSNNVCCMSSIDHLVVSGSWDDSLMLFDTSNNLYYSVFTHPASVLAVKILKDEKEMSKEEDAKEKSSPKKVTTNIINNEPVTKGNEEDDSPSYSIYTSCGDGVLRHLQWKNNKITLVKMLQYHNHPIRDFVVHNGNFYTLDNDGKIFKCNSKGELLKMRDVQGMTYTMCIVGGYIFVGGEHGTVDVLTLELRHLQKIKVQGVESIWRISNCTNPSEDVIAWCGGSDGSLYQIIQGIPDKLPPMTTETPTSSKDIKDQIFSTGNKTYKIQNGSVYEQMDSGEWRLIGMAENKYDHSFNVELNNKNYVLSFNRSENVVEVAHRFLEENNLPPSHTDEIVKFIEDNFRDTEFKMYTNINIEGIRRMLCGENPKMLDSVLKILERISSKESVDTPDGHITVVSSDEEEEKNKEVGDVFVFASNGIFLSYEEIADFEENLMKIPHKFIIYDICKFLVYKKIPIDLSFMINDTVFEKKAAKAFVMLSGNMIKNLPFKFYLVDRKVNSLKDKSLIGINDMEYFIHNKKIRERKEGH